MATTFKDLRPTESRSIPYLKFNAWISAFKDGTAQSFRRGTSVKDLVRPSRNQKYTESWLNLLLLFGAQNIVNSTHVLKLHIDLASLPPRVTNPFAFDLACAALFAGLASCERLDISQELPVFKGATTTLQFEAGGPFRIIS